MPTVLLVEVVARVQRMMFAFKFNPRAQGAAHNFLSLLFLQMLDLLADEVYNFFASMSPALAVRAANATSALPGFVSSLHPEFSFLMRAVTLWPAVPVPILGVTTSAPLAHVRAESVVVVWRWGQVVVAVGGGAWTIRVFHHFLKVCLVRCFF